MIFRVPLLAIGTLALTACSSSGSLRTSDAETVKATVTRHLFGPDQIEVSLNDKVYRGEWKVGPPLKEQTAGETFRHRQHMHSVKHTLKAEDGSEMSCQWNTHLYAADGKCSVAGREYSLALKQDWGGKKTERHRSLLSLPRLSKLWIAYFGHGYCRKRSGAPVVYGASL